MMTDLFFLLVIVWYIFIPVLLFIDYFKANFRFHMCFFCKHIHAYIDCCSDVKQFFNFYRRKQDNGLGEIILLLTRSCA